MSSGPPPSRLTVLCVCTGNVARSPVAERLLAARLDGTVRVVSAGSAALVGEPIDPAMAGLLSTAGASPDGFTAQQLTPGMVRSADLVLALTRDHRGLVVDLVPAAVRRTFTLPEFARLLSEVPPEEVGIGPAAARLTVAAPLAARRRRRVPAAADDVADPYRRGEPAYRQAFAEIEDAVDRVAGWVTAQGQPAS